MLSTSSTPNNLAVLHRLIDERKPTRTLEVGFAFGASALVFADGHQKMGHTGRCHTAIDAWEIEAWDSIGLKNLETAGLSEFLELKSELSSVALPKILHEGAKFDMIYVDGSHEFDDVFVDAYYAFRLLAPGGLVLFDDCTHAPVARVIDMLRNDARVKEFDLSPYRDGSALKYKIGRALKRVQLRAFERTTRHFPGERPTANPPGRDDP
jgi:predicted O-methyltransferase YrrM